MSATPTRRGALRLSTAALFAGIAAPALASTKPGRDAKLIDLCDQFVANETERYLLADHDEDAPDFGPNNARYEQLGDETQRLIDLIGVCESPATPAGHAAVARAALTWVTLDLEGNITCDDFFEELTVLLVQGVAPGFVWPPRPGSCSTAHWAPPPSPKEIADHKAALVARYASTDAKIKAKRLAEEAELHRRMTPSLMTDDELRERIEGSRELQAVSERMVAGLAAEMARRGLA